MVSDFRSEDRQNWGGKVLDGIPVGKEEPSLFAEYLMAHDLATETRRAVTNDLKKFGR